MGITMLTVKDSPNATAKQLAEALDEKNQLFPKRNTLCFEGCYSDCTIIRWFIVEVNDVTTNEINPVFGDFENEKSGIFYLKVAL